MRLDRSFYERDVLQVAPELIGKTIVIHTLPEESRYCITEVEAYKGIEDQASHARFGKTTRNAIMFDQGGRIYVYFIYGIYWMLNIVTGLENEPQAVLIRGLKGYSGPGKVTRQLRIDKSFYGLDLTRSETMWIESGILKPQIQQLPRIGIQYASEPWKSMPWRYIMVP